MHPPRFVQLSSQLMKTFTFPNNSLFFKYNLENYLPKRWAGHSKWQNIKSTKELSHKLKSEKFSKLRRLMLVAIKEGGPNPDLNHKLKALIEEGKKEHMTKATIDKIIKQVNSGEKPYWIVFSGPKDLVMALEVTFSNKNSSYLLSTFGALPKKLRLKLETNFDHLCTEKGLIITDPPSDINNSYEKAVEDAIEIGIDEVFENPDKSLIFECLPERVDTIAKKLSEKGYNIMSANTEIDFSNNISVTEEELKNVETIMNLMLERSSEIIRVLHNAEVQ